MKHNKISAIMGAAALVLGMTACSSANQSSKASAASEAVAEENKAAIVGSWQLSKVLVSETEGENPVEVTEEEYASMFGEKNDVYTFNEDGTAVMLIDDGAEQVEKPASWTTNEDGSFKVTETSEDTYLYDPVDDVLMREFIQNDPYIHVLTVFSRK